MKCLTRFHLAGAILGFVLAGLCRQASAQVVDEYEYQANRVYQVRTGLGITTQIELSPSEQVLDYSTGFSSGWELTRRENVFYLKPKNVDVDTNMMIRTATNSYIFELKVVATDWRTLEQAKAAGVQYKIAFRYPSDIEFASKSAPEEEVRELSTTLEKNRVYNFDYDYSSRNKRSWLIPANVYDDGQFTYIKLNDMHKFPTGNFPAVFGRERENDEDFVVNTTVENSTLIVHGTYPYLIVRHGKNVVGLRRNKQR
ncbi:TrbG/VirB9 family P-type conjugative transfer protein [Pseudoxanthomonas wuyuanensis]|uniref:Type IV secretion system protein VirB9 n=1 Tax=Pseudoxanthomonas wuyuanensis TaxID=1073196 RepID=A0A286DDQ1_9GAMM|nr:TrbG/VirB9 family P-type conjugative transfer protein [Pseudoxanthomonas wuyuanensis]KAF1716635.1 type IV secretion system protein VirB9 [Pseudoxanthomonas wuyuanensis]SOD56786.1 type IV secretion system protein VirB9 [Pseudoxanthomonas wuyuanensis]